MHRYHRLIDSRSAPSHLCFRFKRCVYDYRSNVNAYSVWQAWLQKTQPRLLVLWEKYDLSFALSEPEAYRRDVPKAQIHVLEAGHFALDTAADEIAELVSRFMSSEQ